MTEEEAKTKACCGRINLGYHRETWMPSGAACIGSRCMAWRWDGTEVTEESPHSKKDDTGDYADAARPEGDGWQPDYVEMWSDRRGRPATHIMRWTRKFKSGYCGLAGKP